MNSPLWIGAGIGDTVGTATIATDGTLTVTGHGLVGGEPVRVNALTGGAVGVLREDTTYYVLNAAANTFQLVSIPGDTVITFAATGGADVHTAAPSYDAGELRRAQSHFLFPGVVDRFGARGGVRPGGGDVVTVSGTTWTQHDLTAVVYPGITSQSGPYVVPKPSESASLNPADGTSDRIDALDLQMQDDDEDASGFRRAHVVYVPGTPAATPVAEPLTVNSLRLSTILVSSGGTPSPSVQSLAPWSVSLGGTLPVRDASELPTAGRYVGMYVDRNDEGVLYRWDGSAWVAVGPPPRTLQAEQSGDLLGFTDTAYAFGASTCGQTFTVPASGRVVVDVYALNRPNTFNTIYVSFSINAGTSTVGSELVAPDDGDAFRHVHDALITSGTTGHKLITGLTPGNQVTAWVRHRMSGGNGDIFFRRITVKPEL